MYITLRSVTHFGLIFVKVISVAHRYPVTWFHLFKTSSPIELPLLLFQGGGDCIYDSISKLYPLLSCFHLLFTNSIRLWWSQPQMGRSRVGKCRFWLFFAYSSDHIKWFQWHPQGNTLECRLGLFQVTYLKNKIVTIKHAYLTSTWKLNFLNFFNGEKNIKIKFKIKIVS